MNALLSCIIIMAWIARLSNAERPVCIMETIKLCAENVMARHRSGCTEAMYQRCLQAELYHRNIPTLAEVDVFTMSGSVPINVGRLDLEVDHRIILELKVAPRIMPKHIQQLQKYIRARQSTGMNVEGAAVVCWTDRDIVEFWPVAIPAQSHFFRLDCKRSQ